MALNFESDEEKATINRAGKRQGKEDCIMVMMQYDLDESRELTAEDKQLLERAKALPVVYDDDSSELDEAMDPGLCLPEG